MAVTQGLQDLLLRKLCLQALLHEVHHLPSRAKTSTENKSKAHWIPPGLLPQQASVLPHTYPATRTQPQSLAGHQHVHHSSNAPAQQQGNKALRKLKQKCSGTFLLALNGNKSTAEQQDGGQIAENNQPAELTRFRLVQMFVCSLPRPRPNLLSCSSFVQDDNGAHGMWWLCTACL